MFNTIFDNTATGLSIETVLICAAVALALGIVVAFTHMKTSRTTKGFAITLATLPLLVMAVMIMINGNLGTSIAILGAFSLIRFRSIQGDAKELLSVFFVMMVGLALGMGHVLFAVVITAIAVAAIVIFSKTHFLEPNTYNRSLKIVIPEDLDYDEVFDDIFDKYTKSAELVKTKTMNMGSLYKLTYNVTLKKGIKEKEFLDEIRVKNCNLKVLLSQPEAEKEM
ncbi:DUF4956 domain-containing protein [Candidatus Saccharibacteria bacterium]|nr:DUF4956 domain-containing protein [Candidatus Saccharibacteria bacterium]